MAHPRVLFCSYHCYLDSSSGAARSTRDLLEMLAARGWACGAITSSMLDFEAPPPVSELIRGVGVHSDTRRGYVQGQGFTVHHFVLRQVPVTLVEPDKPPSTEPALTARAEVALLDVFTEVMRVFQPDVVLTYGGQRVIRSMMAQARQAGAKVVFTLRNYAYHGASLFRHTDAVQVPSKFAQEHYHRHLGLRTTAIPGPLDWSRFLCDRIAPQYLTFVNPQPSKGSLLVARLAVELNQRRPDIPLLIVEGRGEINRLPEAGLDLSGLSNVHRMANTADPRQFYHVSRLILMPSVWRESFGRVAAEAMANGIPVLASDRGSLPETLGGTGRVLPLPSHLTPGSTQPPTPEEAGPWLEAIEELWDDPQLYAHERDLARQRAQAWHPDTLLPCFEQWFHDLGQGLAPSPFAHEAPQATTSIPACPLDPGPLSRAFGVACQGGGMQPPQYFRIVSEIISHGRCRLLVFGAGKDTELYVRANPQGQTVVVEHQQKWIDRIEHLACEPIFVSYTSQLGEGLTDYCHLPTGLSEELLREGWDVILVDSPEGYAPRFPGRQQSLYAATIASHRGTTVFVHDYERPLEHMAAQRYLGSPRETIGTSPMLAVFPIGTPFGDSRTQSSVSSEEAL